MAYTQTRDGLLGHVHDEEIYEAMLEQQQGGSGQRVRDFTVRRDEPDFTVTPIAEG